MKRKAGRGRRPCRDSQGLAYSLRQSQRRRTGLAPLGTSNNKMHYYSATKSWLCQCIQSVTFIKQFWHYKNVNLQVITVLKILEN